MDAATTFLEKGPAELEALRDGARAAFVIHLVSMTTGVPAGEIAGGSRARNPAARARWLAMYLLHTTLAVPMNRVAAAFGRHRSTVSQVLGQVEDWRSDPSFEEVLSALERCVLTAPTEAPPRVLAMECSAHEARA